MPSFISPNRHQQPIRFEVTGLFNRFRYDIGLPTENKPVQFLSAPNGHGKSTTLKMIDDLARLRWKSLSNTAFQTATLHFDRGTRLAVARYRKETGHVVLAVSCTSSAHEPLNYTIDIVETQGNNPLNVLGTVHGPGYSGGSAKTDTTYSKTDLSLDYHTYGVLWLPNKISWLLDGKVYFTVTKSDVAPNPWPFNNKFYMILNLAMGGNLGGDIDPTINSTTMNVQWIHYSSVNGQGKVTYN